MNDFAIRPPFGIRAKIVWSNGPIFEEKNEGEDEINKGNQKNKYPPAAPAYVMEPADIKTQVRNEKYEKADVHYHYRVRVDERDVEEQWPKA